MHRKIVFITGATSGLGKETAQQLAQKGATIVFTTRDDKKGQQIKQDLIHTTNNPNIHPLNCDLASFQSIKNCCQEFKKNYSHLHVLINNAGVWDFKRKESHDGIENTFAINYLAPFLMTHLFIDILKASAPARIINITSGLHFGTIQFDDIELKMNFSGVKAYRQSKLALILFTRLLANKLKNTGVTVNCVQPGMTKTNLGRDAGFLSNTMFKLLGQSIKKGAETPIYCATSPEVETITGEYFVNKKIHKSSKESYNLQAAEKLWNISMYYLQNYIEQNEKNTQDVEKQK